MNPMSKTMKSFQHKVFHYNDIKYVADGIDGWRRKIQNSVIVIRW